MSKPVATAFKSIHKCLITETRIATLGLYKSLLRSAEPYTHSNILKSSIRDKFKMNKNTTSRSKVLTLLEEADKARTLLNKGHSGDQNVIKQVNAYTEHNRKKLEKRKDIPNKSSKKSKKLTKRKPYQAAITTYHALGFEFKRVRGWVQPVKTSMMIKNRTKVNQERIYRCQRYMSELEMIKAERTFLESLGCLPHDGLKGFEKTIKMALNKHYVDYNNQRDKNVLDKKYK